MPHKHLFRISFFTVAAVTVAAVSGCATVRETQPTQTAREQLLLSGAADQASAKIKPNLAPGSAIYVDTSNVDTDDNSEYKISYAINTIRTALLKDGYKLVGSAQDANTVAEVGIGALSIDQKDELFGLPSTTIPIPLAGPFKTPEIALWKSNKRTGVAKYNIAYYNAKTGSLQDASGPDYGFSHYDKSAILFYHKNHSTVLPDNLKKQDP